MDVVDHERHVVHAATAGAAEEPVEERAARMRLHQLDPPVVGKRQLERAVADPRVVAAEHAPAAEQVAVERQQVADPRPAATAMWS
ncbi:MAG TPA: hypothetical protein VJ870_20885 [Amycolatopsis sp.]|nr:hypothetical protein [Amycolatopsis sp.]